MIDGIEARRRSGTVTVLALLVSFLFGYAPAAAAAPDGNGARLGATELVKRNATLRASVRSSQTDDQDADSALLPPPPAVHTQILSVRATALGIVLVWTSAPRPVLSAYRARAPPAA